MIMGLVICLSNMPVMAQEETEHIVVQQESDIEPYAFVPDGYVFLCTCDSTPHTYSLGVISISRTSSLGLYFSNEDGKSAVSATVTVIPIGGGSTQSFSITCISGGYRCLDLSSFPSGMYEIRITASALGKSNPSIYYKLV